MQPTLPSLIIKQTQKGPFSQHRTGSGKTTRAIELFRQRDPLVFTPTHRLVKEMRTRGVQAKTYHSFFRWSGQTEWTPERMGQKFSPRVIILDEVFTVPRLILETFLDWLEGGAVATRDSRPLSPEKCPTTGSARLHSNLPTTMRR